MTCTTAASRSSGSGPRRPAQSIARRRDPIGRRAPGRRGAGRVGPDEVAAGRDRSAASGPPVSTSAPRGGEAPARLGVGGQPAARSGGAGLRAASCQRARGRAALRDRRWSSASKPCRPGRGTTLGGGSPAAGGGRGPRAARRGQGRRGRVRSARPAPRSSPRSVKVDSRRLGHRLRRRRSRSRRPPGRARSYCSTRPATHSLRPSRSRRVRTCGSAYDMASSSDPKRSTASGGAALVTVMLQWSNGAVWARIRVAPVGSVPSCAKIRVLASIMHAASTSPATRARAASRSPPTWSPCSPTPTSKRRTVKSCPRLEAEASEVRQREQRRLGASRPRPWRRSLRAVPSRRRFRVGAGDRRPR